MNERCPFFLFYSYDFLSDPNIRECSLEEQGFYVNLLCLMNQGIERGRLSDENGALSVKRIAFSMHVSRQKVNKLLPLMERKRLLQKDQNGVLFSPALVDMERRRVKAKQERMKRLEERMATK